MAPRAAWVLNLDADLELGAPAGYTPTNRVRLSMKAVEPKGETAKSGS